MSEVRLQLVLARAGVGSRRACERLILDGEVHVNGQRVTRLGTKVDPEADLVRVGRLTLPRAERVRWFAVHKPRGYVSTASDPEGRPVVVSLVPGVNERIYPVGRLDLQSEGLILLTNDGELTEKLLHPRASVPRVYRAKVRGRLDQAALERLARGVFVEGRRTRPIHARHLKGGDNATWIEVVVHEGRQHLVRDALQAVGHTVVKLRRIAFGPLELGRLEPGDARELTPAEVRALRLAATGEGPASPPQPRARRERPNTVERLPTAPAKPPQPLRPHRVSRPGTAAPRAPLRDSPASPKSLPKAPPPSTRKAPRRPPGKAEPGPSPRTPPLAPRKASRGVASRGAQRGGPPPPPRTRGEDAPPARAPSARPKRRSPGPRAGAPQRKASGPPAGPPKERGGKGAAGPPQRGASGGGGGRRPSQSHGKRKR